MATVTLLGSIANTNSGTHTVTATPALSDLIVIIRFNTGNTTSTPPTDNNAGGAGTYTKITSSLKATSADLLEVYIRTALVASATSTVFTDAAGTTTGGGIIVYKVTGITRFGAAAARQFASQSNQSAAGTPTPVFSQAVLTGNPVIGAVFNASSPAGINPRLTPSYTEDVDTGYATPTAGIESMHIDSGETGTSIAWGTASPSIFCDVIVEINTSVLAMNANVSDSTTLTENKVVSVPLGVSIVPGNSQVPSVQVVVI